MKIRVQTNWRFGQKHHAQALFELHLHISLPKKNSNVKVSYLNPIVRRFEFPIWILKFSLNYVCELLKLNPKISMSKLKIVEIFLIKNSADVRMKIYMYLIISCSNPYWSHYSNNFNTDMINFYHFKFRWFCDRSRCLLEWDRFIIIGLDGFSPTLMDHCIYGMLLSCFCFSR